MKEFKESLGIDVSKETIDVHLHVKGVSEKFDNKQGGFKKLLNWVKSHVGDLKAVIFCFEHTGIYSMALATFLSEADQPYSMVPALQIKRSLGIVRGKNDLIDAQRIARYSYMHRNEIKQTVLPSKELGKIKNLLSLRERMVAQRAGYVTSLGEMKLIFSSKENKELFKTQQDQITALTKSITTIEKAINKLIKESPEVKELYDLLTSIKGIGNIVAINLIVVTNCFTAFQNSRQLACYCGTAPFEKQSGTSIKSGSRVSHYANKKMKVLLNLAASNAIQTDPELRTYYYRRIEKGKSKMSTLNIVRNKLLHRAFAVVKRRTKYVEIQKWAA
jgi:transposase